jgi:hypothetical protein
MRGVTCNVKKSVNARLNLFMRYLWQMGLNAGLYISFDNT